MPVMKAPKLVEIASAIFQGAGVSEEEANIVAGSLVSANLGGHDSHGIIRIPEYCRLLGEGVVKAGQKARVESETSGAMVLDGGWGFGQVICRRAMELAVEKARKSSIAAVTVRRCAHIGRLGEYSEIAAGEGMIGIVMCNDHGAGRAVAPFGGIDPRLSTNPISIGIPRADEAPIIIDMATSVVAEGKIRVQQNRSGKMPAGWAINHEGGPTTDTAAFYGPPRGAILPFGGVAAHKGFCLSVAVDILAGALSGAGCTRETPENEGNAIFLLALNIGAFIPLEDFTTEVCTFIEYLKSSRLMDGFDEILVPGEPEYRRKRMLEESGISVDETTWRQILGTADSLNVKL